MSRTANNEIRTNILDAAKERMWHYGFKKTTIDEIAADAGVGKGTVYLYFESKEDIALAIVARIKQTHLRRMQEIVADSRKPLSDKLKELLAFPILEVHELCSQHPGSSDVLIAIRPYIRMRLAPYIDQDIAVIDQVLQQGNEQGMFEIDDTLRVARSLKYMVSGFWPPYPCTTDPEAIETEIGLLVDLAIHGMTKCRGEAIEISGRKNNLATTEAKYHQ